MDADDPARTFVQSGVLVHAGRIGGVPERQAGKPALRSNAADTEVRPPRWRVFVQRRHGSLFLDFMPPFTDRRYEAFVDPSSGGQT